MKSIPVTPELLIILKNAVQDSHGFIDRCEEELELKEYSNNTKEILVEGIERRKQLLAITKDLLDRYKDQ